jgi:polygalacturonase
MRFETIKQYLFISKICFVSLFASFSVSAQHVQVGVNEHVPQKHEVGAKLCPVDIAAVKAPFAMPEFRRPSFPNFEMSIVSQGARSGHMATKAIQTAINKVHKRGGGVVVVPAGKWLTGRIELKSNVNLHISEGAELHFSGEVKDYLPVVFTRNEGVEMYSLGACIYAYKQENIAITGKGTLFGPSKNGSIAQQVMDTTVIENFVPFSSPVKQRIYDGKNGSHIFLPMFISPTDCKNVFIEGITLEETIFWNIVPVYCDGVIIRGVTVNSVGIPRGDGIDIESSRNVLIEYCTLNNGDDCFTIKSGRGADGLRVNKPSENIVIRHSLAQQGHGGITLGSETAATIRNVYVHDCVFDNTEIGIRFKTRRPRGGGGQNIHYERIRMNINGVAFRWDMLGGEMYVGALARRLPALAVNELTPAFGNIHAKNIIVERALQFVAVTGIPESPVTNVMIENVDIRADRLFSAADVDGFVVRNARLRTLSSDITLRAVKNLLFQNVNFSTTDADLKLEINEMQMHDVKFEACEVEGK